MKTETVYIIKYNDRFGNGDDTSIDGVIKNQEDFPKWLENRNKLRSEGVTDEEELEDLIETAEEFDIISTTMYTF